MEDRHVFNLHATALPSLDVRAASLENSGTRLCLGLADGLLEEYRVSETHEGLSLSATKHLGSNKAIVQLAYVASASRIIALQEGGMLHALDMETLRAQPVPLRGSVLAIAVDESRPRAPRLAAVLRPRGMARTCRLVVLLLYPAESGRLGQVAADMELPGITSVSSCAWVGHQVILVSELRYFIAAPLAATTVAGASSLETPTPQLKELFSVPADLAYVHPRAVPLPALHSALLLLGQAAIRIDASGQPVGDALSLEPYGTVRAVCGVGRHVLVWTPTALHVLDGASGRRIQSLGLSSSTLLGGGSEMMHYSAVNDGEGAGTASAAAAGPGGAVLAVPGAISQQHIDNDSDEGHQPTHSQVDSQTHVFVATPVPLEQQALGALRAGDADGALRLANEAAASSAKSPIYTAWVAGVTRDAAMLLLQRGREIEALRILERLSSADFQPSTLFALWPRRMRAWLEEASRMKPAAQGPAMIFHERDITLLSSAYFKAYDESDEEDSAGQVVDSTDTNKGGISVGTSPTEPKTRRRRGVKFSEQDDDDDELARREVIGAFIQYFFRAREQEGVISLDGIDALLLHLLMDLDAHQEAAAFASLPTNQAPLASVERRLQRLGWDDALATLCAHRGQAQRALAIFRREDDASGEGARTAAGLLVDAASCGPDLVVETLPWLLSTGSAGDALSVLTARRRDLPVDRVLPLLASRGNLRWRYLKLLVDDASSSDSSSSLTDDGFGQSLRTQLAVELIHRLKMLLGGSDGSSGDAGVVGEPVEPYQKKKTISPSTAITSQSKSAEYGEAWSCLRDLLRSTESLDAEAALCALGDNPKLDRERVELYRRAGRHLDALCTLGRRLQDVPGMAAYAREHLDPGRWPDLVPMLMEGTEQEGSASTVAVIKNSENAKLLRSAARLVALLGLDPVVFLTVLPYDAALDTIAPLLCLLLAGRAHESRSRTLRRAVLSSRLTAAVTRRVTLERQHVTVGEDTVCADCGVRIGPRVFVMRGGRGNQSGPPQVVCMRCAHQPA